VNPRTSHITVAALLLTAQSALAAPDLRLGRPAASVTVYPDNAAAHLFYYAPGDLTVGGNDSTGPDLRLLHARYTGSAATGDRGTAVVRSVFTVRVLMNGPTPAQLAAARAVLTAQAKRSVELRPLPVRRIESALVYAAADDTAPGAAAQPAESGRAIGGGHFDAPEAGTVPVNGYWTERTYTLGLGPVDAQLLSDAFEHGRLVISVGYAFLADGIGSDQPLEALTGSPALVAALRRQLEPRTPATAVAPSPAGPYVVRAGAVGITADLKKWPQLVRRIDINDSAPPGYAALDVYCYDFAQGANDTIYEKQVEISAAGAGGGTASLAIVFNRAQPDVHARSVRFPVAVRLDRPYRFRVVTVALDGTTAASAWQERASWTALLDVTTQVER
jgi:hypothetical protein